MSVQSGQHTCFIPRSPQHTNLSEAGQQIFYAYLTTEGFNWYSDKNRKKRKSILDTSIIDTTSPMLTFFKAGVINYDAIHRINQYPSDRVVYIS